MSLRAVVFDFDGVIADSEPLHLRAFQDVLREDGISLTTEDYYARYLGFDDEGVFRAVGDANRRPQGTADGGAHGERVGAVSRRRRRHSPDRGSRAGCDCFRRAHG